MYDFVITELLQILKKKYLDKSDENDEKYLRVIDMLNRENGSEEDIIKLMNEVNPEKNNNDPNNPEENNNDPKSISCCTFKYALLAKFQKDTTQNNNEIKAEQYIKKMADMEEGKECLLFLIDSKKTSFKDKEKYCEIIERVGNSEHIKKCGDVMCNSKITNKNEYSEVEIKKHNKLCDELAIKYYEIAANMWNLDAIRMCRKLFNKPEAIKYYKMAAEIGYCTDIEILIDELRKNHSSATIIGEDEIEKYYRKSIEKGWFTNARKLTTLLSKEKSIIYLRELVDQYKYYDKTLYILAEALYNKQDKYGAAKYFKMAADIKGDTNSKVKLVDMFLKEELQDYNEEDIKEYCTDVLNGYNQDIKDIRNCFNTLLKLGKFNLLKPYADKFYKKIENSISSNKNLSKLVAYVYDFLSTYKGDLDSATKYCNICDKIGDEIGMNKKDSNPYKLLKKAEEKGIIDQNSQLIGSGGFGSVYKTGNYAVKISGTKAKTPQEEENIKQYLINLSGGGHTKQINHENIGNILFETFKYRDGGDLRKMIIQLLKSLALARRVRFFLKILIFINNLHSNNIIHADLKPDNILLDQQLNPKITDYGLSAVGGFKGKRGTPGYMAPEINNDENIPNNEKVDVYSLGVLLYQIITGNKITSNSQPNVDNLSPDYSMFSDLIKGMLDPDPTKRYLLNEAIKKILGIAQENGFYDDLKLSPKELYYMEVYNEENLNGRKTALLAELKLLNGYPKNIKTISSKEKNHIEILNGGKESSKECKACLESISNYIEYNTNIDDSFTKNLSNLNKKEYLLVVKKLLEARDLKLNCKIFEIENRKILQISAIDIENDIEKLKNLKEKINMKNFATKEFAKTPTTINNKQLENDLVSASNDAIFQNQPQLEQSVV